MGKKLTTEQELEALSFESGNWMADTEAGHAFVSAVPQVFRSFILELPTEVFEMEEDDLRERGRCGINEYALRMAFWQEYERCLSNPENKTMSAARLVRGILDQGTLRRIIANPYKLAWILKPVRSYLSDMEFMLIRGKERLWEILNLPIVNEAGKPMAAVANVVLAAQKQIEERVHGQTIQKQQQIRVNVKQNGVPDQMKEVGRINAIDHEIKQLEERIQKKGVPGADYKYLPCTQSEVGDVDVEIKSERGHSGEPSVSDEG